MTLQQNSWNSYRVDKDTQTSLSFARKSFDALLLWQSWCDDIAIGGACGVSSQLMASAQGSLWTVVAGNVLSECLLLYKILSKTIAAM